MPLKITKPKGRRYWYIVGTVSGIRIRESAQTTSKSLAEALKVKREAELQQRRIHGPGTVATFAEAVNMYLDSGGEDRFLGPVLDRFGKRRLTDLAQSDLDAGAREAYRGAKVSTVNRQFYTPFISVMNEAALNDLCHYRKWRRLRGHNKRTKFRWLTPEEFERVYVEASLRLRALFVFLVGVGARTSEAQRLRWDDVDLPGAQAWIWKSKTDEARRIELPPRVVAELANLDGREGLVFGGASFRTGFKAAMVRAGLGERLRNPKTGKPIYKVQGGPHLFRHTFATWFYSQTLDRERLKGLGGWKSNEVDRYCHLAPRGLSGELARYGWDFTGRTNPDSAVSGLRQH